LLAAARDGAAVAGNQVVLADAVPWIPTSCFPSALL
jgi:hypothetical protein